MQKIGLTVESNLQLWQCTRLHGTSGKCIRCVKFLMKSKCDRNQGLRLGVPQQSNLLVNIYGRDNELFKLCSHTGSTMITTCQQYCVEILPSSTQLEWESLKYHVCVYDMSKTPTRCPPIVEFVDKDIHKKPIYLLAKEPATMILLINIQCKYSLQVHITITQNEMLVNLCANDHYLPSVVSQPLLGLFFKFRTTQETLEVVPSSLDDSGEAGKRATPDAPAPIPARPAKMVSCNRNRGRCFP